MILIVLLNLHHCLDSFVCLSTLLIKVFWILCPLFRIHFFKILKHILLWLFHWMSPVISLRTWFSLKNLFHYIFLIFMIVIFFTNTSQILKTDIIDFFFPPFTFTSWSQITCLHCCCWEDCCHSYRHSSFISCCCFLADLLALFFCSLIMFRCVLTLIHFAWGILKSNF